MNYWILATFILGLAAAIAAFFNFDTVIRTLYDTDRDEWEKAGKPMGFFWLPPGRLTIAEKMAGSRARGRSVFRWMFSNPAWIEKASPAYNALGKFRLFALVMLVFFIISAMQIFALTFRAQ